MESSNLKRWVERKKCSEWGKSFFRKLNLKDEIKRRTNNPKKARERKRKKRQWEMRAEFGTFLPSSPNQSKKNSQNPAWRENHKRRLEFWKRSRLIRNHNESLKNFAESIYPRNTSELFVATTFTLSTEIFRWNCVIEMDLFARARTLRQWRRKLDESIASIFLFRQINHGIGFLSAWYRNREENVFFSSSHDSTVKHKIGLKVNP